MKVVVAPDSFKGTLSAGEAAAAIARGWRRIRPTDQVITSPMSDGGDGVLDVLGAVPGWTPHAGPVSDPLGRRVRARWLVRPDMTVIESAQACGLHLVSPSERRPRHLSSYGVGEMLVLARRTQDSTITIGLGGSATVDGGLGMLSALGTRMFDGRGRPVGPAGAADLPAVATVQLAGASDWEGIGLRVLADVTTPLTESAAVFGPQKGASDEDVAVLTRQLQRWADLVEADLGLPGLRDEPGSGAAGGLGFALLALGAEIVDGANAIMSLTQLDVMLTDADLVITGEGRFDETSSAGKVVGAVTAAGEARGVRVAAVVGQSAVADPGPLDVVAASPAGPGPRPATDVEEAAAVLAARATDGVP